MLAAGFGVLASIAIQFTAEGIVSLFTDPSTADGAAVILFGGQYLRGYILTVFLLAFILVLAAFFAHAGNPACRFYTIFSPLY